MLKELAEKVIDTIYDIVFIVDANLNVTDTNNAVSSLGYVESDLVGKPFLDLIVDNRGFREAFPDLIKKASEGERRVVRFEAIRKDGSKLWVDITASAIDATPVVDYLLTVRDVDERAKQRKELEEQKSQIETVLKETDKLRKEAEESKLQLQVANEQLAKRQALTEAALLEEQKIRLNTQKTGFQKSLAFILAGLVLISVLLPYSTALLDVQEKVIDSGANFTLILLQILGQVVAYMFGRESKKDSKDNE